MMQLTGIKMVHVPYKGIAPAMTAILAGDIEITYVAVLTGLQHFKAGKLSPPALAGRSRYPALPDVPTAAEAGLPGFRSGVLGRLAGAAGVSAPPGGRIQRGLRAAGLPGCSACNRIDACARIWERRHRAPPTAHPRDRIHSRDGARSAQRPPALAERDPRRAPK